MQIVAPSLCSLVADCWSSACGVRSCACEMFGRLYDRLLAHVVAAGSRLGRAGATRRLSFKTCYLVDPASSHMLVSKIKPCMCKYELIQTVKLRMAH